MDRVTTTIKREFFRPIVAGEKRIEYRTIKDYWEKRFAKVSVPFRLRLINGMSKTAPECIVEVTRVRRNTRTGYFELHLGRIFEVKHWDRRRGVPK